MNKNIYQVRGIILIHLTECGWGPNMHAEYHTGQEQRGASAHRPHLSLPLSHKRWWWISGLQWQAEGARKRLQSSKWFAHKQFPKRYQELQIPAAPSTVSASKRNSRSPGAWKQRGQFLTWTTSVSQGHRTMSTKLGLFPQRSLTETG